MNEFEYASRYFGEYKLKGDEIVTKYCPFCGGGEHRDKGTFALNVSNHTYNCKRGSCGVSGHFSELLKLKGESFEEYPQSKNHITKERKSSKPSYKTPETAQGAITDKADKYLSQRGFSPETVSAFGVKCDDKGNLIFPYYITREDFDAKRAVFMKFRKPEKITSGRKMWREADTMPVLYGLHLCSPDRNDGFLYICEGEFDAMALWQMTGGNLNVVSVPSGAEDFTWIETCEDVLKQYKVLCVVGDNDAPGQKMAQDIVLKFADSDLKVCVTDSSAYGGCKDMNEIMVRAGHGRDTMLRVIGSLHQPPVRGLKDIAEVHAVSLDNIGKTRSGIRALDRASGGFLDGDITVWTGKRGEGKSTFLNQVILQAVDDGKNVCVYSGEIPDNRLKNDLTLCAAGYLYSEEREDRFTGRRFFVAKNDVLPYITEWLARRIWIYDNNIIEQDERDSIIERFAAAYKQYDCRVFVVDNLMVVRCNSGGHDNIMQIQADFIIRLQKFAQIYGVHVHVVVHPRKVVDVVDSDDVGGLGTITNIACNVYSIRREESAGVNKSIIRCLKNRAFGVRGDIELEFNERGRRFFEKFSEPIAFGWESRYKQDIKIGEKELTK